MKKVLMIVGGLVLGLVVIGAVVIFIVTGTSKKLVCKSPEGDITIYYTDKAITGYSSNGVSYDLDGQKAVAKQIGTAAYVEEFKDWFESASTGSCK